MYKFTDKDLEWLRSQPHDISHMAADEIERLRSKTEEQEWKIDYLECSTEDSVTALVCDDEHVVRNWPHAGTVDKALVRVCDELSRLRSLNRKLMEEVDALKQENYAIKKLPSLRDLEETQKIAHELLNKYRPSIENAEEIIDDDIELDSPDLRVKSLDVFSNNGFQRKDRMQAKLERLREMNKKNKL
jgi:hypothetical protein